MEKIFQIIGIVYVIVINIVAIWLTIHDKRASMQKKWRVPESTLLLVAALSGCVCMYLTMRVVHHKTQHPKFMIGIPAIFVLEVIAGIALLILLPH